MEQSHFSARGRFAAGGADAPKSLADYVGSSTSCAERCLEAHRRGQDLPRMIFRPPGVGKTTLARNIAREHRRLALSFSAVTSGIKEIRTVMQEAEKARCTASARFSS